MEEAENSENGPIPKEDSSNSPVKACALCGCSTPAVRCDRCNSQTFCLSCDDMYHRHPKRKLHLRKAVDSIWSSARSPRIRRRTDLPGDPSKIPIPPPRSRKKERHTIGGRMFSRPSFEMSGLGIKSITPPPKDMYSSPKLPKNTMEQTYENEAAIVKSQNPNKPEEIYENENVIQEENRATSAGLSQSPWNSPQSNISPIQVSIPSSTPEMLSNGQSFGFPPKPQSKSITDLPTSGMSPGGQHMYHHAPHPYPYGHPQMQPPYSHSMAHLNCAQCISSSWSNLMSPHPSPYFHPMSWGPMHPGLGRGATPTAAQGPMKHSHGDLGNYPDPNFPYPYPPGAPYYPNGVPSFDPNTLKDFSLPNPGSAKVRRSPSSTRSSRHAHSIEDLHSSAEAAAEPSEEPANTPDRKVKQDVAEEEIRVPVVSNEPWACLHCTFINPPGIYICQVCCKTSYGNKPPDDSDDIRMESPVADNRDSESPMELVNMDAEIMTSKLSNLKRQKVNDDICQDSLETSLENEEAFKVCNTENATKSPDPATMLTTETQTSTTTKSTDVQTQNLICKTMASSTDSIFPKHEMSVQTEIEMPGHCTVATDPMISSHSMESLMSGMSAPPYHNRRAGWGRGTSYSTQSLYDRGRSRSPLPRSASMYNEAHSLGRDSSLPPEEVLHSWNPAWLMSDPMYYKPHNMPESSHSLGKEDYYDGTWGSMDKLNRRVKSKHAKKQDSHHMPKFHRSLDDLKNDKHQEIIHSQELQFLQTVKEAERCGFSLEDLHVAYLHCGRENPVFWLEDNWSSMIKNVIALAAKYGEDNEENDVGTISLSEAKEALHIHRGDIWDAVTECIENRQRKILELTVRGNFTQKQISDALTHNEGNVELAYADLFRASNKRHKFILSPGLSEDSEDLSFSIQTEEGDILAHSKLGKHSVHPDSKSEKKKSDFLTKLSSIRQAQSERRKAREEKELERENTAQELPPVSPLELSSRSIDERAILQSPETGEISEEGVMPEEIPVSPVAEIENLESVDEKIQVETISKPDTQIRKKDFEEDHLPVDYDGNWGDSQGEWIEEYSDEQWDEENDGNWVSLQKKFHNMEKELAEEAMQMAALWEKEELEDDVFEQEPTSVIETHLNESDKLKSEQDEKFQQWVKVNLEKNLSETEEEPINEPVNEEIMSMEVKEPVLSKDSELDITLEHNLALENIQSSEQHLNIDLHDANLSKSVEFDDTIICDSPLQHYPTEFDLSSKSFMESDWVELKSDTNILQEEKQMEMIESSRIANELSELENILPDSQYKSQEEYEHENSDGEWEKVDFKDLELLKDKEDSSLQEKEMLSQEEFNLPESVKRETEIEEMPVNKLDPFYENKQAVENILSQVNENFDDNKPKPPLRRKSKLSALEIQMALMNQPTPTDNDVLDAPPAIPLKAKNKISEQTQLGDLYAVPDKKAKTKSPEPGQLSKTDIIEKEIEYISTKSENVSEIVPPKPPRLTIPQSSSTFSKETSPVTSEFNESDSNCFADSESDPEIKMVRQKMHKKYSRHEFDDELENDQVATKEKSLETEAINLGLPSHQTVMKQQDFDPELPIPIGTRGVQANDDILSPKAFREGSARPLQLFKSSKSESIESTEEKSIDFASPTTLIKPISDDISLSQDHSYYNTTSKPQTVSQLQKQPAVENTNVAISGNFMEDNSAYNANYYNINEENRNKIEKDPLTIQKNVSPAVASNLQSSKEKSMLEEFPPNIESNVSNINEELLFTEMEATSAVADYFFGRYNEVVVAKPKKKVIVKIDKSGMPAMPKPMTVSQIKSPTPPISKSSSMEQSASPVLGIKEELVENTEKETPKSKKPASPLIEKKKVMVPEPIQAPVPTETLSFAEDYFFGSYNEIIPPKKKTKNIAIQQIPELPITRTNLSESSVFQGTLSSSDSIEDFQDAEQFMSSMSGSLPSISEVGSMYEDAAESLSMISYDLEEPSWRDYKSDVKGKSVHFEEPQPPIAPPPRRNRGQHVSMSSTALGVGESTIFQTTENPQSNMLAKKKLLPTSEDFKIIQGHDPSEYSCDIPLLPCETPESLLSSEISVQSYNVENSNKDLSCENVFYIENSKESIDLPVPVFSSDISDAPVSSKLLSNALQLNDKNLDSSNLFKENENVISDFNLPENNYQDENNAIIDYTLDNKDLLDINETIPLPEINNQNNKVPLEKDLNILSKENATASLDDSYEEDSFQLVEQTQNIINDFCDLYLQAGFDTSANEVENYNVQNNNQDSTYDSEHEWKLNEERNNSLNATFIENPLYNIGSETCSFNIINQNKLIISSEIISEEVSKDITSTETVNETVVFDENNEIIEDLSQNKGEEIISQNISLSPESVPSIEMEVSETVSHAVQPLTILCQTAVKNLEPSVHQTSSKEELVKELKELLEEIDFSESISNEDLTKAEQVDLSCYDLDSRSSSIQTIISTTLESNTDRNEIIKDEETINFEVINELKDIQDSNIDEVLDEKIKEYDVFNVEQESVDQDIQESSVDEVLYEKMKDSDLFSVEQMTLGHYIQESEIDLVSDDNKVKESDVSNVQDPNLDINKFNTLSKTDVKLEIDTQLNQETEHVTNNIHTLKDVEDDSDVDDLHSLYELNKYQVECSLETENQYKTLENLKTAEAIDNFQFSDVIDSQSNFTNFVLGSKHNEEEYENPEEVNISSFEEQTCNRELSSVISTNLLSSLSDEAIDSLEHYPQIKTEEENEHAICINSLDEENEEISIMSHFYEEWFEYAKPTDGTEVKKDLLAVYASYSHSESSATSSANVSVAGDFVEVNKEDLIQASVLNDIVVMDDDLALNNISCEADFKDLEEKEILISDSQEVTDKIIEHKSERELFDEKLTDISSTYHTLISESTLQLDIDVVNNENSFNTKSDSLPFDKEVVLKDFSTEAISKQQSFRTSKSCQTDDSFEDEKFFDSFDDTFTIPSFIQLPFSKTTLAEPVKMEIGIQCSLLSEETTKSYEMILKSFDVTSDLKLPSSNSIQVQAVFSDDFNEEDSEMISAASSIQQRYQNTLDKDIGSSSSESLEDSDSDFFVEPHSFQDEADIDRKGKKAYKGLLFIDADSDTGFSSGSDTGKYVTVEKQGHTGEKILISDEDSLVRHTYSNEILCDSKVSLEGATYPAESNENISSDIAKVKKDNQSEVLSSDTFFEGNILSNIVSIEEIQINKQDSNLQNYSHIDNLSTSTKCELEKTFEQLEIINEESNANIRIEKESLKHENKATTSQAECTSNESYTQESAFISNTNSTPLNKSLQSSDITSEGKKVSEIVTEQTLLTDTDSVIKLQSDNEKKKKIQINISQEYSDSSETKYSTLPKEIIERALTPVSEEKFPTYDSDLKFIDVEYVDAKQLETKTVEEKVLTPTIEYFYGYLPTCSPPEVIYDRRDSYFEALEILDECVSDVQKSIFENQNIYRVTKKEKSNSLTSVHENDEIEEFCDASPLKADDDIYTLSECVADLEDTFEEPLTENVLDKKYISQTSFNEHENEVFVLSSEDTIKISPTMSENNSENMENLIFEDAIEDDRHIRPDVLLKLEVSQKIIRQTNSTDQENEVFLLSSDEITDNIIVTQNENYFENTEDLVFQDAIGDIVNKNLHITDVRSGECLSSDADVGNSVDQLTSLADTDKKQIFSQKSFVDSNVTQHSDLNNLSENIHNNKDIHLENDTVNKSTELSHKTSDLEIICSGIIENNKLDASEKNAIPLKILCENKLSECKNKSHYSSEVLSPQSAVLKTDKLTTDILGETNDTIEKLSEIPTVPSDIVRYLYYDDSIQFEDDSSSSQSTSSFQTFPISAQLEIENKDLIKSDVDVPELLTESKTLPLKNVCDTGKLKSSSLTKISEVSPNIILKIDGSETKQTSKYSDPVFVETDESFISISKKIDESSVLDVTLSIETSELENIQNSAGEVKQSEENEFKKLENQEVSDNSKDKISEMSPVPSDSKDEISNISSVSSDSKDKLLSDIPSAPSDLVRYLYYDDSIHFEDDSSKSESTCSFQTSPISTKVEMVDQNKMSSPAEISELLQGSCISPVQMTSDLGKHDTDLLIQEDSSNIIPSPSISEVKQTVESSLCTGIERFDSVTSMPLFIDKSIIPDATHSIETLSSNFESFQNTKEIKPEIVSEEKESSCILLLENQEAKLDAIDFKIDNDEITDISTHFTMTDDSDKFSEIESDSSLTEDKCFFELDNLISDIESDVLTNQNNLDEHLIKQNEDILDQEIGISNSFALEECTKVEISGEKDVNGNITTYGENLNLSSINKPLEIRSIPKDQISKCEMMESNLEVLPSFLDSNQHDISIDDKSQCQNSEYFPLTDSISSNTSEFISMYHDISEIKTVNDANKINEQSLEQTHQEISSQPTSIPKDQISKCEMMSDILKLTTEENESNLEVLQSSVDSNQHDISSDDKSQCQNSEYFPLTDSISSNTSEFLSIDHDIAEIKTVNDTSNISELSLEQTFQKISSQPNILPDTETHNVLIYETDLSQCADKISLEKETEYKLESEKNSKLEVDSNNMTTYDSNDSKQQEIVKLVMNEKDNVNFEEKKVKDEDALKSFGHLPSMSDVMQVKSISNSCNKKEMSFSVLKDNLHGEFKNDAEKKEKHFSGLDIDLVSTIQPEFCGGDNTFSFKSKMGDILGKELNVGTQDELNDKEVVDFKGVYTSEEDFLKDNGNNKLPGITFKEETSSFKDYANESETGSVKIADTSSYVDFKMKEIKNLNEGSDTSQDNPSVVDFKGSLEQAQEIIKSDVSVSQNGEEPQLTVNFKEITNNNFLNESDKVNKIISSSVVDCKSDLRHDNDSEKESFKVKQLDESNETVDFKGMPIDKNSYVTKTNDDISKGIVDLKGESQQIMEANDVKSNDILLQNIGESALKKVKENSNIEISDNKNNNKPIASSNSLSNEETIFVDFKGCVSNIENILKENGEDKFSSVSSHLPDKNARIEKAKVDKDLDYNADVNFEGTVSSCINNSFATCYDDDLSSYYSVLDNVDNTLTFISDSEFTDSHSYVTLDDTDVPSYVSLEDTDIPSYVSLEDTDIPSYVSLEDTDLNSEVETDAYHEVEDLELDQFSLIKEYTPTKELVDYSLFQTNTVDASNICDSGIQKEETKVISESKCFKLEIGPEKCPLSVDLSDKQLMQQKIENVKPELKDKEKTDEHKKKSDLVTNLLDSLEKPTEKVKPNFMPEKIDNCDLLEPIAKNNEVIDFDNNEIKEHECLPQVDFKGPIQNNEYLQTSSDFKIVENKSDVSQPCITATPIIATESIKAHTDSQEIDSYQMKESLKTGFISEHNLENQKEVETIQLIERPIQFNESLQNFSDLKSIENKLDLSQPCMTTPITATEPIIASETIIAHTDSQEFEDSYKTKVSSKIDFLSELNVKNEEELKTRHHIEKMPDNVETVEIHEIDSTQDLTDTASFTSITDEHETFSDSEVNSLIDNVVFDSFDNYNAKASSLPNNDYENKKTKGENMSIMDNTSEINAENNKETLLEKTSDSLLSSSTVSKEKHHTSESIKSDTDILQNLLETTEMSDCLSSKQNFDDLVKEISNDYVDTTTYESISDECEKLSESDITNPIEDFPLLPQCADDTDATFKTELTSKDFKEHQEKFIVCGVIEHPKDFPTNEKESFVQNDKKFLDIQFASVPQNISEDISEHLLTEHFAEIKSFGEHLNVVESFAIFEGDIAVEKIHEEANEASLRIEKTQDSDYWLEADTDYSISEFDDEALSLSNREKHNTSTEMVSALSEQKNKLEVATQPSNDNTTEISVSSFFTDPEFSEHISDTCADISLQGATTENSDKWSDIEGDGLIDDINFSIEPIADFDMNVCDSSDIDINKEQSVSLEECATCPEIQDQIIDSTDEDSKIRPSKELSVNSAAKVQIPSHSITVHISQEIPNESIISSIVLSSLSENLQPLSDVLAPISGLSDEEFTSVTPLDMTVEESDKWSDISDTSIEEMEDETASISLKASTKDQISDVPSDFQAVQDEKFVNTSKSNEQKSPAKEKCNKDSKDELNASSLLNTVEKEFTASIVNSEEYKIIEEEEIYCSESPIQYSPDDLREKEKLENEYLEEIEEFTEEAHEYIEETDEFAEEPREYIGETDEFNENFEDAEIELDENGYPILHTPYIINDDEFVYPLQYTDWIEESFDLKEYGIDTVLSGSESDVHGYGIHEEFENIERMIDLNASNFDNALENIVEEDKTTESFKTLSNGTTSHLKISDKEHDSWSTADAASIEDDEFPEHDDVLSRIDELLAEDFKDFHTEDDFKNESDRFELTPSNELVNQSESPSNNVFISEKTMNEDSFHNDLLSKYTNIEDNSNESSALLDSISLEKNYDVINLSDTKSINEKDSLEASAQIIKRKDKTKDLTCKKDETKASLDDMPTNLNVSFSSTKDESALLYDQEEKNLKITSLEDSLLTKCSEVDDTTPSNQIIERNKTQNESLLNEKDLSMKNVTNIVEVDKSMLNSINLKPNEETVEVKNLNNIEIQAVDIQPVHPTSVSPEDVKCVASGKAVIDINTSIKSNIEMQSQESDVKLQDIAKPDIPCKQKHKKQTIDPHKSLSISSNEDSLIKESAQESIRLADTSMKTENIVEVQPNIPHKTEDNSSIVSIASSDINKTPTHPRRRRRQLSTEAASLSSSSESLSSCESSSSKFDSSNESDNKDSSDIPSVPVRRRRSVQSPAVGSRRRSSSDNSSASSTSKSSIHSKSSPAPDLSRKRLSIDERVAKLQSEGKCSNKETAFIAAKLIEMQFEEEDALLASKQCSSVYHAIKFLTQLCELCNCRFPINLMASMVDCTHRACKDCLKAHFTTLIYDRSIFNLLCPICHMPDITDQNIQEYFNHLDFMLRSILDSNVYDLFQQKLRDEVLTKDPNFHWCSQCSSGFIASPRLKKLYCPDCSAITCALCNQTWELEHEGVHCERFQQWKDMHTPEPPPAGTVKFLTDRGITCPSCGLLYAQACGGCLMYKCSHCSHEFCGFCTRPFKRAKDCSDKNCLISVIHTHHPASCLFFIRDKEISDIQMLLEEESVTYLTIPPKDQIVKSRCQVREQKLIHGSISEDRCGRDIVPYCAGLCKTHYYEYLAELLRKNKISPLSIMTSQDLQYMLRKSRIYVPEKIKGETNDEYYKRNLEAVNKTLT